MSDYLHLPAEIWSDILTKLPVKSILRCRCVCKTWYSLISSPNFVSDHTGQTLNQSTRNRVLVHVCDKYTGQCTISSHDESFPESSNEHHDLPKELLHPYVEIVGYGAGLFCLSKHFSNTQSFLVWNPSIRKLVELPSSSSSPSTKGRNFLGFGFDSNTGDYKVLRVVYRFADSVPFVCEIFDLSKGVWRSLSPPVTPFPFHDERSCVNKVHFHSCLDLNGSLHWMANEYSSSCFILSFHLSSEVFTVMDTPDDVEFEDEDVNTKVLSINGLLSVALLNGQEEGYGSQDCWSLWSKKEYHNTQSWTVLFRIEDRRWVTLSTLFGFREDPSSCTLSTLFGFREKGEVVIVASSERDNEDLVLYNPESRESNVVLSTKRLVFNVWFYKDSLVLL